MAGSTNSRPVLHLLEDQGIPFEFKEIDLLKGANFTPEFLKLNPLAQIPVMVDHSRGEFILTESHAIMRYIASQWAEKTYPSDPRQRARVDEMMCWAVSHIYVHLGYNLFYPQAFPQFHGRPTPEAQAATLQWGSKWGAEQLAILDKDLLSKKTEFACGDTPTLADYALFSILSLGEMIRTDFKPYPNIQRWLDTVKNKTKNKNAYGAVEYMKGAFKEMNFVTPKPEAEKKAA